MGLIHPSGDLMLSSGLRPSGNIKTPLGAVKPTIPRDGVEQYPIVVCQQEEVSGLNGRPLQSLKIIT